MSKNRVGWTVLCERGKKILDLVNKQVFEVQCCSEKKINISTKLLSICIQMSCLRRVLV